MDREKVELNGHKALASFYLAEAVPGTIRIRDNGSRSSVSLCYSSVKAVLHMHSKCCGTSNESSADVPNASIRTKQSNHYRIQGHYHAVIGDVEPANHLGNMLSASSSVMKMSCTGSRRCSSSDV
jgi:hypothetical protein